MRGRRRSLTSCNLGLIFGVPDRAAELTAELEGILADVEERVADLEPVDVLAMDDGDGPVNAYGGSGLFHQMIEIAGGRNVLADLDEDYTQVSAEQIAASNPRPCSWSTGTFLSLNPPIAALGRKPVLAWTLRFPACTRETCVKGQVPDNKGR